MAISATRRAAAYEAKLDSSVTKSRIDARKTTMISEANGAQAALADIEAQVRSVLGGASAAVPVHLVPSYLAFGRELYKITRKHVGKTVTAEAQIIKAKWTSRGLTSAVLIAIALDCFGITVT